MSDWDLWLLLAVAIGGIAFLLFAFAWMASGH